MTFGLTRQRTEHNIGEDLIVSHLDMAYSNTQAQDLLELEFDGRSDLSDLSGKILRVRYGCGELAGLGETRAKKTRNLFDKSFRGKKSIVFLGKLLDELLVLVESEKRKVNIIECREKWHLLLQVID